MRRSCIFIASLVLVAFCSVVGSDWSQGPEKCCFSFTNARIPLKQIESYYTTHLQCNMNAVIFIIRAQREICTNPTEKWVRRLMKMVDNQNMKQMTEAGSVDSA
ncbi:chemokine (C-C motif) ligand 38, duplicate 1 isoform X2 [Danio rerio]|uniref:Chemokine (C-C motif) ligand 38, duplicate 1 isoform X2 n=1 Tax=Danio rerio TaxID=7955 RepID=A0AC58I522_DANRE